MPVLRIDVSGDSITQLRDIVARGLNTMDPAPRDALRLLEQLRGNISIPRKAES